jgi:L-lactate dehydrogenase complex protein LldF
MSPHPEPSTGAMLHPELQAQENTDAIFRNGRRLDHAEGTSKPLRSRPERRARADRGAGKGRL